MHPEPEDPLAAALHAELRRLPPRPAPAGLIPNVLSALAARQGAAALPAAWWERSWFEWPQAVRRLSGVAAMLAVAALAGVTLLLLNLEFLLRLAGSATEAWGVAGALGNALAVLGRSVPTTALIAAGALFAVSYLCAIALGTVFFRYTWQRR